MRFALGVAVLALACGAAEAQVIGAKPSYLPSVASEVPNAAAIGRKIFVPGLEEGWIPQGLAVTDRHVLVSSYKPTPDLLKDSKGPCRVFRIDAATGQPAGQFDVPAESCNSHAGGLAYLGEGRLVLADTYHLSLIELDKAVAAGSAAGAIRTVPIKGALRGSLAASQGKEAWIGMWSKDSSKSRMYRLPASFFDSPSGQPADESVAAASLAIPIEGQGAAFDKDGNLWTTASRSNAMSKLYRLDRQGNVAAEHDMPMGLEGIAFDAAGRLWAVSESGTRKYQRWGEPFHFPFVFEIDVGKLR